MRRIPVPVAALVAAALLSGCGSTAQQADGTAGPTGGLSNDGPAAGTTGQTTGLGSGPAVGSTTAGAGGLPQPGSVGSSTGATTGSGGTTSGTTGPTTGSGGATGGSPAASGTTGSSTTAANGPGVTSTTIAVGIVVCNECDDANAALGVAQGNEDPGEQRDYFNAALADVNDRGGVLGRKLIPVFHEIRASGDVQVGMQAACETWTKDNKVLAVYMRGEIVYECANKAGAIAIAAGEGGTAPLYERFPNLFSPSGIRLERLGAATVKAMVRAGWHKPEAPRWPHGKIGLITWDNNDYRYGMKHGYLAALQAAGLKETDVRYVTVPQGVDAIGDANASISAAVLAFQSKNIDHVFIQDGPAGIFGGLGLTTLFLNNAESQRYYPRYGFNTNNGPGNANYPSEQQVGMIAIDASDLEPADDAGIALNPQRERCFGLMKKRSLKVAGANTRVLAASACQVAWFLEDVLKRTGGATTLPAMITAAESLGPGFKSPLVYGTRIARGQHDGVALFRNSRWDESCRCMKFTSKPYEP